MFPNSCHLTDYSYRNPSPLQRLSQATSSPKGSCGSQLDINLSLKKGIVKAAHLLSRFLSVFLHSKLPVSCFQPPLRWKMFVQVNDGSPTAKL